MRHDLEKLLIKLVKDLRKKKINFAIVGSVALYLQGMDVNPHDIDIITDKKNFDKIVKVYFKNINGKIYSEKEELKDSFYFCHFVELRFNKLKVEILADTWARNKKTNNIHKSNLKLRKFIKYENQNIPVMPIEEELKAKETIMWKPQRINKIKRFLEKRVK